MRSVKVKIFGFTVYEYLDDSAEGVLDVLKQMVDADVLEEVEPEVEGRIVMASNSGYGDPDAPDGHVIFSGGEDEVAVRADEGD